ncbi:putative HTH-type transcriptional regulator YusO [Acaryochloris thomasi RCC1774]|uniref:Putative HTH-type transcriptional regulator YusO n=1 Tax=Acaryochloris thomasi RCC1774 TaxID=1764569 RepID=A0A2W1JII3_9CYAN|nr:putative HTH-type transcriptional regulator YusO [Acaryochloris thomasi RCC1774]
MTIAMAFGLPVSGGGASQTVIASRTPTTQTSENSEKRRIVYTPVLLSSHESCHAMPSSSSNADFLRQWHPTLAPYNLGYKVKLVSQLMYRDFLERLEPHGLTPFHYLVLCCLWEEDGLSTSGIANKLKQLGATLTGVVDRMEDRNLVYRERDSSDRRIVRIWLIMENTARNGCCTPIHFAVAMLASNDVHWTTGQSIRANSGIV